MRPAAEMSILSDILVFTSCLHHCVSPDQEASDSLAACMFHVWLRRENAVPTLRVSGARVAFRYLNN